MPLFVLIVPRTSVAEFGRLCSSPLLTQHLSQFSRDVVELLKHSPQCRMPFSKFIPTYHHHFGRQCRVADYGYTKLMELFDAIPHVVQVGHHTDGMERINLRLWGRPDKMSLEQQLSFGLPV